MLLRSGAEVEQGLANGERQLVDLLGATLAVQRSTEVRASLAEVAKAPRYALALRTGGPYLLVHEGVVTGASIAGLAPTTDALVTITELEKEPRGHEAYQLVLPSAAADATRTIRVLAERADLVSSEDFAEVLRWAPVVAVDAYRQSIFLQLSFDETRRNLLDDPTASGLRLYWERAHLLAHLTLIAGSALPTSWLSEMAQSFSWQNWTPSFPLVRERMLRLAVRGGWMSARFGTTMTEPYLQMLESGAPLRAFDGVLALVSIAVAFEGDRRLIHRDLSKALARRAQKHPEERIVLAALQRSADCALESPDEAVQRTLARGRRSVSLRYDPANARLALLRAIDDDEDGAAIDEAGFCPAILAMTCLAGEPASVFFGATQETSSAAWAPERALAVLARTGTARNKRPTVSPPRQMN